jgi:ABC-type transport system involved in cytochrome bd biosynthesis fused ATPase/permease subunit
MATGVGATSFITTARLAEILVLDEATADIDIDPATEVTVATAISRLGAGRRLLVVAHRPATAARANHIVTVHADGNIGLDLNWLARSARPG